MVSIIALDPGHIQLFVQIRNAHGDVHQCTAIATSYFFAATATYNTELAAAAGGGEVFYLQVYFEGVEERGGGRGSLQL